MLELLLQAVALFIILSLFYWLLYKYLPWHGTFMQPLAVRLRFWVYLFIPICSFNWFATRLYQTTAQDALSQPWTIWLPQVCINTLLVIIGVETLSVLVFDYLYKRRRRIVVPQIIQSFVRLLLYLLVFLLVLLNLFNIKIVAGILLGAALVLVGLGLLLRNALSDLFSGFSLQITRLYNTGDWLRIGEYEGRVETTDWRSVTLRTISDDLITLPLSLLAQVVVVNLTSRHASYAEDVSVIVDYAYPPAQVERALREALEDLTGIATEHAPVVTLQGFQDQGIRYVLRFWITDFTHRETLLTAVHRAIWYHFRRAKIRFAYPATNVYLHQQPATVDLEARMHLLREIAFLQLLSTEQLQRLAGQLDVHPYANGEVICRQGEPGRTFYVIVRGRVHVQAVDDAGREIFAQRLEAGSFFGEFSLLTGEARTATVTADDETELLVMDKEDMRQLLEDNPRLAEHISGILAQRRHELQQHRDQMPVLAGPSPEPETVDSLKREFLRKILDFFSY